MSTIFAVVAVAAAALTFFSIALAALVPDEYDERSSRVAPAYSRAIRVRP